MNQFGAINSVVTGAIVFGNLVEKGHGDVVTPIPDPDHHLTLDALEYEWERQSWQVEVKNKTLATRIIYNMIAREQEHSPCGVCYFLKRNYPTCAEDMQYVLDTAQL